MDLETSSEEEDFSEFKFELNEPPPLTIEFPFDPKDGIVDDGYEMIGEVVALGVLSISLCFVKSGRVLYKLFGKIFSILSICVTVKPR